MTDRFEGLGWVQGQRLGQERSGQIVTPFLAYLLEPAAQRNLGLGINIVWWEFYVCLWSLAAICDLACERHRRGLEMCADLVRRGIHMGVDETGIIGEGPFYGSIEIFAWLMTAEVLARAGGITGAGDQNDVRIVRGPLREPRMYTATIKDLVNGKATDVVLAPGDIVYVTKAWYTKAADVLNALARLVSSANTAAFIGITEAIRRP